MFPLIPLPLRPSHSLPGPRKAAACGEGWGVGRRGSRQSAGCESVPRWQLREDWRVPRRGSSGRGWRAPDWLSWLASSPDWLPRGGAWQRAALSAPAFSGLRPTSESRAPPAVETRTPSVGPAAGSVWEAPKAEGGVRAASLTDLTGRCPAFPPPRLPGCPARFRPGLPPARRCVLGSCRRRPQQSRSLHLPASRSSPTNTRPPLGGFNLGGSGWPHICPDSSPSARSTEGPGVGLGRGGHCLTKAGSQRKGHGHPARETGGLPGSQRGWTEDGQGRCGRAPWIPAVTDPPEPKCSDLTDKRGVL